MCGIVGSVGDPELDVKRLSKMLAVLRHRGPDGEGIEMWPQERVALGHRRLSIIDLSPAGRNPMANEDGTVWITFNGEIFNFQELRCELEGRGHRFSSRTDTEVILHAYEEWGDGHVDQLRGMFAYALYDRQANGCGRLLLVRDRLGIKPLFYSYRQNHLLFASEIKALLAYPGVDRHHDRSALFDYLTYGYIPPPKTAYRGVRELPAGHRLVHEGGELQIESYWGLDPAEDSPAEDFEEASRLIRETLQEAVRLNTVSDVPVGVFLSGGIDSSAITALMAGASGEPVRTFSVGFDVVEHTETAYARLVADQWQTRHREHHVGFDSARHRLPQLVGMYDQPFAGSSALPTYLISAAARKEVKVVLSGDGGDEVFAGYDRYRRWLSRQAEAQLASAMGGGWLARRLVWWPLHWRGRQYLNGLAGGSLDRYAQQVELFTPREKRELLEGEWRREFSDYDDYWFLRQHWRPELDPVTRVQILDLETYLPAHILAKVDRASMAVSLEVRPPLLDHVLVERVFAISAGLRFRSRRPKALLKHSVKDLLPEAVLERHKKGFSSPVRSWLAEESEWVGRRLQRPGGWWRDLEELPWLAKRPHAIWGLVVLQQWLANEGCERN